MAGRKKNLVQNFFKIISGTTIRCKLCSKLGLRNMPKHLQNKHPHVYKQILCLQRRKDKPIKATLPSVWLSGAWVEKYTNKIADGCYECHICKTTLKMRDGHLSNMKRHIQNKHPYVFLKEMIKGREKTEFEVVTSDSEAEAKLLDPLSDEYDTNTKDSNEGQVKLKHVLVTKDEDNDEEYLEEVLDEDLLSEEDPDIENKIRELCFRKVPGKIGKGKNCFWNFFECVIEDQLYRCIFCAKHVAIFPRSVANLKRHINRIHSKCYNLIMQYTEDYQKPSIKLMDINEAHEDNSNSNIEENLNPVDESLLNNQHYETEMEVVTEEVIENEQLLSEDDPDIENKIRDLCTRKVPGKRKKPKNCFWNFFECLIEDQLYRCIFCTKQIVIFPGSLGNLKRHINRVHPKCYNLILSYSIYPDVFRVTGNVDNLYFESPNEGEFKCKTCGEMLMCFDEDHEILFNHIKEKHPEEIQENQADDEYSILLVKSKELKEMN